MHLVVKVYSREIPKYAVGLFRCIHERYQNMQCEGGCFSYLLIPPHTSSTLIPPRTSSHLLIAHSA
eukprot:6661500-Pyramimonas_sp.AAC.1